MEARRSLGSGKQHGAFRPMAGHCCRLRECTGGGKVAGEAIRGGK